MSGAQALGGARINRDQRIAGLIWFLWQEWNLTISTRRPGGMKNQRGFAADWSPADTRYLVAGFLDQFQEIGGFQAGSGGFASFIGFVIAAPGTRLRFAVAGQNAEGDRNLGFKAGLHQAKGRSQADELEVRGLAFNDTAETDHATITAGACQGFRDERNFECAGSVVNVARGRTNVVFVQVGECAAQQALGDLAIEAAHDQGKPAGLLAHCNFAVNALSGSSSSS